VMKELQRRASLVGADADVMDDLRLVREQVDRCRAILERMSADAGETIAETFVPTPLGGLVATALADLPRTIVVRTAFKDGEADLRVRVPPRAFGQALRGIVKNAQEASASEDEVVLTVSSGGGVLAMEVRDRGTGIPAGVLERVGEPFFTTKPAGRGMGLGVFLARTTVERLGGELRLTSSTAGTVALFRLPASVIERGSART
jgi:two-component system sensor histidine kinase RegB